MPEDRNQPNPDWESVPQGEINGFEMRNGEWVQVRYIIKHGKITEVPVEVRYIMKDGKITYDPNSNSGIIQ